MSRLQRSRRPYAFLLLAAAACTRGGEPAAGQGSAASVGENEEPVAAALAHDDRAAAPIHSDASIPGGGPRWDAAPRNRPGMDGFPNVVVVLVDTLRPLELGLYGHESDTAPFLSELAARSVVFENAFSSSSWTAPAVASLFTGLYPTEHGVIEGFLAFKRRSQRDPTESITLPLNRIPDDVAIMPELLREAGFRTFGVITNLNVGSEIGFDRGFDRFHVFHKNDAGDVVAKVDEWNEAMREAAPYFLYLHFMEPHIPYHRRAPWYEEQPDPLADDLAAYRSEIRFLDEALRSLYERYHWSENTLLVFVSDHGEEFEEHGGTGHGFSLYGELNRMLLMVQPVEKAPGRRAASNVSIVDVLPTVLAQGGVVVPPGLSGENLSVLIQNQAYRDDVPAGFARRTIYAHRARLRPEVDHLWAAIRGEHKLLLGAAGLELYHAHDDPYDQHDLAGTLPEIESDLKARLGAFRAKGIRTAPTVQVEIDPELQAHLEELGYAEDGE